MITSVTYLNADLIKITLNARARIDSLFLDAANWVISAAPGYETSTSVACVKVLTPTDSSLVATDTVFLQTTLHTLDAVYEVRYLELNDTTGFPFYAYQPSVFPYRSRATKVDQILKSLPSHFDKRATSNIRNIVTALGLEDDLIGGARNDAFSARPIGFGGDGVEAIAPFFLVNPFIYGLAEVGNTLTCDSGVYSGTSPISISFQWKRTGVDIVGATSDIYITDFADVGEDITCTVSLLNIAGSIDFTTALILIPPSLLPLSPAIWLEPNPLDTLVGGRLSNGFDLSGNSRAGVQATDASRPLLVSGAGPGGRDCWRFSGARPDFLSIAHDAGLTGLDWTFFVVAKITASPGSLFSKSVGPTARPFDGIVFGNVLNLAAERDGVTNIADSAWRAVGARRGIAIAEASIWVGGAKDAFGALAAFSTVGTPAIRIGQRDDGYGSLSGDIACVCAWNRALTDVEIAQVHAYFLAKFGI